LAGGRGGACALFVVSDIYRAICHRGEATHVAALGVSNMFDDLPAFLQASRGYNLTISAAITRPTTHPMSTAWRWAGRTATSAMS